MFIAQCWFLGVDKLVSCRIEDTSSYSCSLQLFTELVNCHLHMYSRFTVSRFTDLPENLQQQPAA